jgi:hypothetical protein
VLVNSAKGRCRRTGGGQCSYVAARLDMAGGQCRWTVQVDSAGGQCRWTVQMDSAGGQCSLMRNWTAGGHCR